MPFMRELASFQLKTPSGDWEPASLIQWGPFLILWAGTPVVYALAYGGGLSLGASPSAVNVELLEEALQGSDKQGGGEAIMYSCQELVLKLAVECGGWRQPKRSLYSSFLTRSHEQCLRCYEFRSSARNYRCPELRFVCS